MRRWLSPILTALAVVATALGAQAQDYPTRQITLIAPWPAGGAVDALCRAVATPLSDRLGKSVVVENRPGAGSVIGTAAGAKATPDGELDKDKFRDAVRSTFGDIRACYDTALAKNPKLGFVMAVHRGKLSYRRDKHLGFWCQKLIAT